MAKISAKNSLRYGKKLLTFIIRASSNSPSTSISLNRSRFIENVCKYSSSAPDANCLLSFIADKARFWLVYVPKETLSVPSRKEGFFPISGLVYKGLS